MNLLRPPKHCRIPRAILGSQKLSSRLLVRKKRTIPLTFLLRPNLLLYPNNKHNVVIHFSFIYACSKLCVSVCSPSVTTRYDREIKRRSNLFINERLAFKVNLQSVLCNISILYNSYFSTS